MDMKSWECFKILHDVSGVFLFRCCLGKDCAQFFSQNFLNSIDLLHELIFLTRRNQNYFEEEQLKAFL